MNRLRMPCPVDSWSRLANPFGKVVEEALLPTPLSAAVLAILGTLFAIVMLITYVKIIRKEVIKRNLT